MAEQMSAGGASFPRGWGLRNVEKIDQTARPLDGFELSPEPSPVLEIVGAYAAHTDAPPISALGCRVHYMSAVALNDYRGFEPLPGKSSRPVTTMMYNGLHDR
jgi:hypothetical protein